MCTLGNIADRSPNSKCSHEHSIKRNVDMGYKNASANDGISEPIVTVHIFTGSVKYFTDKSLANGKFYTNGHLPTQAQINALTQYLIDFYNIKSP